MTVASPRALGAEKVLYSFKGGNDGQGPGGPLIADKKGNLYGVTESGGGGTNCYYGAPGCGTVFKFAPDHTETVLYAFSGGSDGDSPDAGLTADAAGNLYGITSYGGTNNGGTVFKLTPNGTETVLYAFQGESDGSEPDGTLLLDSSGDLFGVTAFGGKYSGSCVDQGCGTVFELKSDGTKVTLYSFQGGSDGYEPGNLIMDASGNIFGVTVSGGDATCASGSSGCGVVFKLAPDGTESVLYAFKGGSDGNEPVGLMADASGNFYGTTIVGGGSECDNTGCGTVFELAPNGTETVLYSFKGGNDGEHPYAGVIQDSAGNLYGTTLGGGGIACPGFAGCGTVFKLAPGGTETILYAFHPPHGRNPTSSLLMGKHGLLYGATGMGGRFKDGVIFDVKE